MLERTIYSFLGDSITKSAKPCTKHLINVFNKYKKPAISIREVPCEKVCSYLLVDGDKIDENIYRITQLIEKPKSNQTSSNLAILGRYILTDDIFDRIKETKLGFNSVILLTNVMPKLDEFYGINSRVRFSTL